MFESIFSPSKLNVRAKKEQVNFGFVFIIALVLYNWDIFYYIFKLESGGINYENLKDVVEKIKGKYRITALSDLLGKADRVVVPLLISFLKVMLSDYISGFILLLTNHSRKLFYKRLDKRVITHEEHKVRIDEIEQNHKRQILGLTDQIENLNTQLEFQRKTLETNRVKEKTPSQPAKKKEQPKENRVESDEVKEFRKFLEEGTNKRYFRTLYRLMNKKRRILVNKVEDEIPSDVIEKFRNEGILAASGTSTGTLISYILGDRGKHYFALCNEDQTLLQ